MGHAKDLYERQSAQGWSYTDGFVCTGCVDDYALQADIASAAEADHLCSFCGRSPAAEMDVLIESFMDGLWGEYGDADNEAVHFESREGGYQASPQWDTYDLIDEFWDVLSGPGLLEKVKDSIHDRVWVERNFSRPRQNDALWASWTRFCEAVQYETRYVFWLKDDPEVAYADITGDIPPSRILDEVGKLISDKDLDLLTTIPEGYEMWRARTHESEQKAQAWAASDLGTARREDAKRANRMSPAGIPLFYGSEDMETAVAEVAVRAGDPWVTAAAFETSVSCTVVDFSKLPEPPSMFDTRNAHMRRPLLFLHQFVAQLSKPARTDWEQLDYVPTQIVTEYLLRIFLRGEVVAGILYPSAQTGRVSAVFDVRHGECVEQQPGWSGSDQLKLGMKPGSKTTQELS